MQYESELRHLIANLAKTDITTTDNMIYCPICRLNRMEFGNHKSNAWVCLKAGCGFTIPEKELPGPDEIKRFIKEVKSEKRTEEIKEVIRDMTRETIEKEK